VTVEPEPHAGDLGDDGWLPVRVNRALRMASTRMSFVCESDGTIAWVSDSVEALLGYRPGDLVGTHFQNLYAPADRPYSERGFATIRANPGVHPKVFMFLPRTAQVRHADGRYVTVESHPTPILHDPTVNAVLMEWHLVADRRLLLAAIDAVANSRPLEETTMAVADLFESLLPRVDLEVLARDGRGWRTVGCPRHRDAQLLAPDLPDLDHVTWHEPWAPVSDRPWASVWAGSGQQVALVPLRGLDGVLHGVAVIVGDVLDGIGLMIATVEESLLSVALRMLVLALAHARSQAALRRAAEHDPLTGLLNRAGFDRHIADLLAGPCGKVAVLMVDLDDFKPVNDTYGHPCGDDLLGAVARRLECCLREGDIVARLGGDEFAVLCSGSDAVDPVAQRIVRALGEPFPLSAAEIRISASLGAATGPSLDLRSLLVRADTALYEAKRSGKNRAAVA
jgi:diguanylate cyclase (GGDEF)-like protein/PAS domain S-box-containing protein